AGRPPANALFGNPRNRFAPGCHESQPHVSDAGDAGKPGEYWQKFRDAIATGTGQQIEKTTRRGKSVAWEIDVETASYRIPKSRYRRRGEHDPEDGPEARSRGCDIDRDQRFQIFHPGRGGGRS